MISPIPNFLMLPQKFDTADKKKKGLIFHSFVQNPITIQERNAQWKCFFQVV